MYLVELGQSEQQLTKERNFQSCTRETSLSILLTAFSNSLAAANIKCKLPPATTSNSLYSLTKTRLIDLTFVIKFLECFRYGTHWVASDYEEIYISKNIRLTEYCPEEGYTKLDTDKKWVNNF